MAKSYGGIYGDYSDDFKEEEEKRLLFGPCWEIEEILLDLDIMIEELGRKRRLVSDEM